jgi:hypothetical protein
MPPLVGAFELGSTVKLLAIHSYERTIEDICSLNWSGLTRAELTAVAWAYYFFSVQFRENLELARNSNPDDEKLLQLYRGECDTANLSPFPGVAAQGERMNHDEFMRRILVLSDVDDRVRQEIERLGASYLAHVRQMDSETRAISISSYENGGLESVFRAILQAEDWDHRSLQAFKHFLVEHIRFDSDADAGHGALSRHMAPDDRICPLWDAFRDLLVGAAPALLS